ncbi:MAG: hypothetical protein Q8P00_00015 [Dehalococcoidia bacterium]|nr:hypothetical protein [Dehalococcoidia bacterium]
MPDFVKTLILAGIFTLLGIILLAWGGREGAWYGKVLSQKRDLREFVYGWPDRPELIALKIGGWVSFILALVSLVLSLVFWIKS